MGYLPFFQFYPQDWLIQTARLSPKTKGLWIDIMCRAWNEPLRGHYERDEAAIKQELGIDTEELENLVRELQQVTPLTVTSNASVTPGHRKVTVKVTPFLKFDSARINNVIRQRRFKSNARSNAKVTLQTLDVKTLDVRRREKEEEKEKKNAPPPASPKGPAEALQIDPQTAKQIHAQNYEEAVRAKVRARLKGSSVFS